MIYGVVVLLLLLVAVRVFWVRRTWELHARLLEVLARAVDRGAPLPPLLARAAMERGGRAAARLRTAGERLDAGAALSVAGAALFPRHVVGAIRAAEGTPALPSVLAGAARDTEDAVALRHRVLLVAVYPVVVGAGLYLVQSQLMPHYVELAEVVAASTFTDIAWIGHGLLAALVAFAAWLVLGRLGWLPTGRFVAAERFLGALGPLVEAGQPVATAFRRAADAVAGTRLASRARTAADALDAGAPFDAACAGLGLPSAVAGRLAAAGDADAATVARRVRDLAADCARRHRARADRVLAWISPAAIAVLGFVAAMQFAAVMRFIASVREGVLTPW